ncbi:MAG: L-lactate permease, partial [Xanthobacteraceae bacterium]
FGAFFEGASGFGTPVAVTGAILIGLGFSPLAASGLSLIANTAPVAYGALGTPIAGLASVTGFSLLVPFWLMGAVFAFTYISFTGSGMLLAAIISGFVMGFSPAKLVVEYGRTIKVCAYSLITISAMLAIGTLTRYSGIDATLGLAFAGAGVLYPFFGTLLGWLGVALTGSDTASNVLFGGLQKITAEQLGLSPILMGAANSSGGVMGKMIDAQSIVVASTATNWFGHEGSILRFVFFHSIALACLVGVLVTLQAYVFPGMIVH